jgi:uncharacterized protein YmfQ (DUF2313 family)
LSNNKWFTLLRDLLPEGDIFELIPDSDHEAVFKAMSIEFGRLEEFYRTVRDEAFPGKIDLLLDEWVEIYNINPDLTDAEKQATILSYYTAIGNQSLNYIQTQINKLGFGVVIIEFLNEFSTVCGPAICGIAECGVADPALYIQGNLTTAQFEQVKELIEYYKPAHVQAYYNITFTFTKARCNVGKCLTCKAGDG